MTAPINPQAFYNQGIGGPYYQTYQPVIPQPQYQYISPQRDEEMKFVRGQKEAEEYPTVKRVLLFDANEPIFYIKDPTTGLRVFDYTERNQNDQVSKPEYVTRSEFDEMKKLLDELTK